MKEILPPNPLPARTGTPIVFLSGSIEMGVAEDWQADMAHALQNEDVLILNPRRKAWDASWKQDIANPQFREQVTWELDGLDIADIIAIHMDPGTKSPITLLELGLHAARHPERMIVCCPQGFWRKGNVDIVCARYGIAQVDSPAELASAILRRIAASGD